MRTMNDDITARGGRARHGRRFGLLVALLLLALPLPAAFARPLVAHAQSQTAAHTQSQTALACPAGNGLFVLYYGAVQNPASADATMQTIESEQPGLVVFGDGPGAQRSRGDIPSYVHQYGGKALMYVALGYGANDPTTVDGYVTDAMNAGYDGIFFDEAATDSATYQWNSDRAAHVKSFGASKLVVMNPGTVPPDASMFDYADIVSVENQYTQQLPATWGIPSWRWLAVQGDPASAAATSAADAESRLTTFRSNGGYWYYSSAYASSGATAISLPSWYTTFATWARGQVSPACPASVDVTSMGAVGDGSTDDTAAFHHAIDALTAGGGGTLVVPPGVYSIKPSSLTFPSNVTVAGNAATLRANAVGFTLVDVAGTNITVSGVTFDGAGLAVQGVNIDAGSSNVTMRDSTVAHLRQPADATLYPDLYGAMPVGVFVRGDGHTVTLDNMTIKDIVADHNDNGNSPSRVARGVLISPGGGQHITTDVTVRNSAFDGVGPIDDGDCVVMQDSDDHANLQVVHNTFTGCAKRAVKIQTPGALIEDNTITNSFLGNNPCYTCAEVPPGTPLTYDMYAGISVYQSDVRVVSNTIGGVGSYYNGIELGDTVHPLTGVVIQSNTVSMGAASNISAPSSLIRDFGPDTSPIITGNTLSHAAYGIYMSGPVSSPAVANNTITDVTTTLAGLASAGPTNSSNLLTNGDFASGITGWTPYCHSWGAFGSAPISPCMPYASAPAGLQLTGGYPSNNYPYSGIMQTVDATATSTFSGTLTLTRLSDLDFDDAINVRAELLDASNTVVGTITFYHHPRACCSSSPYIFANSSTSYYQDMPSWVAGTGQQTFLMNIGDIVARRLSDVHPAQVTHLRLSVEVYSDGSPPPSVVVGNLSLTSNTPGSGSDNTTVTDLDAATTTDPTGAAQASIPNLNAAASGGMGTVTVADYAANPTSAPLPAFATSTTYFDVKADGGNSFTMIVVRRCGLTATDVVYWWTGTAWTAVSPQTFDTSTGCTTMSLSATSSPAITQLTGTMFGVGASTSGNGSPGSDAATPELGSGELLATGLLGLAGAALHRRRARRAPKAEGRTG